MKLLSILGFLSAAGAFAALPAEADGLKTLRRMGLKAYVSVLDADQKSEAKRIGEAFLLETAPDRLEVEACRAKFRAGVAALLTLDQRREAVGVFRNLRGLDGEGRRQLFSKLLDGTDRAVLADRVDRILDAPPAEQAQLALAIHDQLFAAVLDALAGKLALTADQQARVRALHEEAKAQAMPAVLRLAEARSAAVRAALSLLRPEQREKLDSFRADVMEKLLDFLRG